MERIASLKFNLFENVFFYVHRELFICIISIESRNGVREKN